jgi:rhodanese-related sulfurtransferase
MRRQPLPMNVDGVLARARAGLGRVEARAAADELRRGALLVDIRPEAQRRREGEVEGALVIERNVLEWRLDPTSSWRVPEVTGHDQRVIVICQEGYSSSLAAATLRDLGLDATDVIGGYEAWAAAGLASEKT